MLKHINSHFFYLLDIPQGSICYGGKPQHLIFLTGEFQRQIKQIFLRPSLFGAFLSIFLYIKKHGKGDKVGGIERGKLFNILYTT